MNYYEKVLILNPTLDDSGAEEIVAKIKDVILKQSGEIIKIDNWGRRKLAYELNKQQKGNYFLMHFKAPSATIAEIEKYCRLVDTILKFMVLKLTKKKQIDAILNAPAEAAVKAVADETASAEEAPAPAAEGETSPEGA